jgi:hypothetical protein
MLVLVLGGVALPTHMDSECILQEGEEGVVTKVLHTCRGRQ